jgi:hypothetical protein
VQSVGSGSVWAEEGQAERGAARIKEIVDSDSEGNNQVVAARSS